MSNFLGPDFLLDTAPARRLYHDVAADLPIIDYHNHLPPQEIATDHRWDNPGELWLGHDHYKWRVMRWVGIDEHLITGEAPWRAKFDAFASAMPQMIGNPVYHWSHLELWRYFGLEGTVLNGDTAETCWNAAADALPAAGFSARGLLKRMKVELVGTTDDPLDSLEHHAAFSGQGDLRMVPSFRPDRAIKIEDAGFADYIQALAELTHPIQNFDDLVAALCVRLDHFVAHGCRASDHGIDRLDVGAELSATALDSAIKTRMAGGVIDPEIAAGFRAALLVALGRAYAARGLVMQLHMNVMRNTRTRLLQTNGRDAGGDSIRDAALAEPLNTLLDRMDRSDELPRTILYGLDPSCNPVLVTTAGNFQDGSIAGKVQAGTAWWFNDQLDGMEAQMTTLAQMGLISTFPGMLTDSRSFLSFPRHEYFRRLLCRLVGRWQVEGAVPADEVLLNGLVADICYHNAKRMFVE
ncbi:MAG: glucuronate isomerase [Marinosulfonomonas sp.]|nr:glucuronate isomerase [Marinosulfonomonas sp.]